LAPRLDWLKRHQSFMQKLGGVVMIAVGVSMLVGWWDLMMGVVRQWVAEFGTIL
ncbi:MAG: cytochrome C biogenesis protein, partial [Propionibacterium sp.]|nr:cytochrome C biogenesis protein [Propionibacterium sp.]